jgi:CPA1 family monovalent cation:H+ antiporter
MEFALVGVIAVITIVVVAAFSKQLGIAAPLVLVLVGLGVSLIPSVPDINVPPWLILEAVLPPLLYSAAVRVPLVDFRRNFGAISTLSVVVVIVTALAVGLILYTILPRLDLGAAIALGAVVSPTDAVAATAMAKRLGLPARLVTVLEGESLVNDASSLVLLKTALAATGATISLAAGAGVFAYSVVMAIVIGLIVGILTVFVRSKLQDPVLDTVISFAVPFMAYLPVEAVGGSGVLGVVVAGLYSGHNAARSFTAQSRISERLNWRTVQFVLENGVFLLMGLQLKSIVSHVIDAPEGELSVVGSVALGLLVVVLLVVIRAIFVAPLLLRMRFKRRRARPAEKRVSGLLDRIGGAPQKTEGGKRDRVERVTRILERRSADLADVQRDAIGWRGGIVLTWAGMRGVVTLAAAQSLPTATPYRSQLILIAFTVAIFTLLVQGGTLPWVIRLTKVRGSNAAADRRELATLLDEISEAGAEALEHPSLQLPDGEQIDQAVLDRLRQDALLRSEAAWERVDREESDEDPIGPHRQYRALRAEVLRAERAALLEARSRGAYPSRILSQAQGMLDLEESRLERGDPSM